MSANRNKRPRQAKRLDAKRPAQQRPDRSSNRQHSGPGSEFRLKHPANVLLYGRNSVEAALKNPQREHVRLMATPKALEGIADLVAKSGIRAQALPSAETLAHLIPSGAPHQGLLLEVKPLDGGVVEDLTPLSDKKNIVLMLDQVTDPQNVGACLRSAAAFGARAVITQDRNSPAETGTLARASAGGLEVVPWIRASNLAQALDTLKDMGYWHMGLDGSTDTSVKSADLGNNIVLVMGSEGKGLRPLVRKHCDVIAKIPMTGAVESLNVSNAAAIALYELTQ
ncbi:MAG: 23S rRNA (guanosine(2251)-2'-O)-methyltransferase RlmB [Kordiimonadaceae bacterium]|nr:23S rRNA (guanosine(2251)-2'-O)-methyltransferase RlmB [Kordiimonadaceae bacterium]MBO6567096.1 23S rRNA (guanosine(2251)-2'-O)-methyltransferase RlmB [Kordiimonadaceae bacterium]MBO6963689.1 23S rRNA (guanosine(2251)-2'-O)-methyltransferase RlmB [Kordiimonadaceae bacterium]